MRSRPQQLSRGQDYCAVHLVLCSGSLYEYYATCDMPQQLPAAAVSKLKLHVYCRRDSSVLAWTEDIRATLLAELKNAMKVCR